MLLTNDRLRALHNINRWGGWLKRPYSVLEHTLIGAKFMVAQGQDPKPFLLHDMEETEFGDLVAPNKRRYTNGTYRFDVDRWVDRLCAEAGIHSSELNNMDVKTTDHMMAHAEHLVVASRGDPKIFGGLPITPEVRWIMRAIDDDMYRGSHLAVDTFWGLYNAVRA